MTTKKLIGPFKQLLSLNNLPLKGALSDNNLTVIENAGIIVDKAHILQLGDFNTLKTVAKKENYLIEHLEGNYIGMPGIIDAHTHICWAGNRAKDYAMRLDGKSYIEIAKNGGGIWDTVQQTRNASLEELTEITIKRANALLSQGTTTIEVKSGYGLSVDDELKILQAIRQANAHTLADLIPTCLAAHICPKDFWGNASDYLNTMAESLLPEVLKQNLAKRVDIFIEDSAFSAEDALDYLLDARQLGFDICVHADQFTCGGSSIAVKTEALSVDHLEASGAIEIDLIAKSNTIAIALPGASIGLADPFTPGRALLDAGASLAIASDWNPGSAPMGDLLTQAAIFSMHEKLNTCETLSAITYRAAAALNLNDRGVLKEGNIADFIAFELDDYADILYNQGRIKPSIIYKNGNCVSL